MGKFQKATNKGIRTFKTCEDCRFHLRESRSGTSTPAPVTPKHDDVATTMIEDFSTMVCSSTVNKHAESGSIYPRDTVPTVLFRKVPDNPRSHLLKRCLDCRRTSNQQCKEKIAEKKAKAAANGLFFCTNCHRTVNPEERAYNIDGSPSILCLRCKQVEKDRSLNIRKDYDQIKQDFILKTGFSCQACKSIYFKPPDDGYATIEIKTFDVEGNLWAQYEDNSMPAIDFVNKFKDRLEVRFIELDHLTETEQRERGVLLPGQLYVPKKLHVSKLSSRKAMQLEALKCQHLCCRCHLEETIRREIGKPWNDRSHAEREKLTLATETKIKIGGCNICGYWNPELIRFFDFDHINPEEKRECIARMIKDKQYTVLDLTNEMAKCRLLCRHCHRIHTVKQDNLAIGRGVHKKDKSQKRNAGRYKKKVLRLVDMFDDFMIEVV